MVRVMSIKSDESVRSRLYPPLVVMGVSGAGKSTVGRLLAESISGVFIEGDDLHSEESKAKMAAGVPLTDRDRDPWLRTIVEHIRRDRAAGRNVVVACSALKRSYRDKLSSADPELTFVYLASPREVIAERQKNRYHEYMPSSLLDSQFATLEPPADDERHIQLEVDSAPEQLVKAVLTFLGAPSRTGGWETSAASMQ